MYLPILCLRLCTYLCIWLLCLENVRATLSQMNQLAAHQTKHSMQQQYRLWYEASHSSDHLVVIFLSLARQVAFTLMLMLTMPLMYLKTVFQCVFLLWPFSNVCCFLFFNFFLTFQAHVSFFTIPTPFAPPFIRGRRLHNRTKLPDSEFAAFPLSFCSRFSYLRSRGPLRLVLSVLI
jgi:hypothetical protein